MLTVRSLSSSVETAESTHPHLSHDSGNSTELEVIVPKDPAALTPATARALLDLIQEAVTRPR